MHSCREGQVVFLNTKREPKLYLWCLQAHCMTSNPFKQHCNFMSSVVPHWIWQYSRSLVFSTSWCRKSWSSCRLPFWCPFGIGAGQCLGLDPGAQDQHQFGHWMKMLHLGMADCLYSSVAGQQLNWYFDLTPFL